MTDAVVEIDIASIAAGGDGIGRADRLAVFVPRTAPGDRVRARIRMEGRLARGEALDILQASADRVEPPCAHYRLDRCGGCQVQHLRYEAQLRAKSGIIADALTRIGKRATDPPVVRASARQWRYRTKLTLAMRQRGTEWIVGLHPYDDPSAVFPLVDCPITDERVVAIWREVISAWVHYPPAHELRCAVRLLADGAAVTMEGGARWSSANAFFAAVPSATALWWQPVQGRRRLIAQRGMAGAGASFTQVNPEVAAELRSYVIDRIAAYTPATVVDAYAGSGELAAELAKRGMRVTAIEIDRDAAAAGAARLSGDSRMLAGRVEDVLPRALPADVVVVNPPRGGLHDRVPAILQEHRPRALLYVSCNPATLARDLARLPVLLIASLLAFDMFPQTAHVETVCELVPEDQ